MSAHSGFAMILMTRRPREIVIFVGVLIVVTVSFTGDFNRYWCKILIEPIVISNRAPHSVAIEGLMNANRRLAERIASVVQTKVTKPISDSAKKETLIFFSP